MLTMIWLLMAGLFLLEMPATIIPLPVPFELYKWLTLACLFGMGLNILLRADYAKHSMVNLYPTRWSFVCRNWVTIIIRICPWGLGAFYYWTVHPETLTVIAKFFKVPDWLANWMTFPVNVLTSLGLGFAIDIGFDKIQAWSASVKDNAYLSWLNTIFQGRLPQYDEAVVDVANLSEDRKVGETGS